MGLILVFTSFLNVLAFHLTQDFRFILFSLAFLGIYGTILINVNKGD